MGHSGLLPGLVARLNLGLALCTKRRHHQESGLSINPIWDLCHHSHQTIPQKEAVFSGVISIQGSTEIPKQNVFKTQLAIQNAHSFRKIDSLRRAIKM